MHNKKQIFCFIVIILFLNNSIISSSFLPLVQTEWNEEIEENSIKKYIHKKGEKEIPADAEYLILKLCDFDTLVSISMVNKTAKNTIGYFFYENLASIYNMFKTKAKTHSKSYERLLIEQKGKKYEKKIKENVEKQVEEFYASNIVEVQNNYRTLITKQKCLLDGWSPMSTLVWSSRHVKIDSFRYFMLPYAQFVESVSFFNFSGDKKYIARLQMNTHLKDLTVNFPQNNIFPDLSGCTSLTSITINNFDAKKHTLTNTLESLKNIPNLSVLDLSDIDIGPIKNSIKALSTYSCLETLKVQSIVKYKYKSKHSDSDEIKKYKKLKERVISNFDYFYVFPSLQELKIRDKSDYFLKFVLYYYKLKNEIPIVLIPYLEKAFNNYKKYLPEEFLWDEYPDKHCEEIINYVFSVPYDYFLIKSCQSYTYPLAKKQGHFEKIIQKIIWKEIGNEDDMQKLQKIITASDCPIYFELYNQKNIEKQLELLHYAEIDHKKIVGMLIEVTEPIRLNAEYLSKYDNLYLSLRIKGKKTKSENEIFFNFSQGEFPTIAYLNTNNHMIFLEDQSRFPSLKKFIYNNVKDREYDFQNFSWKYASSRKHVPVVVFKSFECKNALIWRKEFEDLTRGFGGHSILAPHQNFINILFENHIMITNKKIIKLLESIKINCDELKSLEILFQYSYHEIPYILKKILAFPGKIKNEEDWKIVQEKYLPIIQEQIELKKSKIKTLANKIFSIFPTHNTKSSDSKNSFFDDISIWQGMFFGLCLVCGGLLFCMKKLIVDYEKRIMDYQMLIEILKKNKSTNNAEQNHAQ